MIVDVVTVFTPRPQHEKWMDYRPLLELQKKTVERFGHRHIVVTDAPSLPGFNIMKVDPLPESLMKAILVGQLAYLESWSGKHPVVLVDADCLVARNLADAFSQNLFDLGLTNRENDKAPINNGAMYISAGNKPGILAFYRKALSLCLDHWGGDQEAISQAAAPVPKDHIIEQREGLRISFLSMKTHSVVPTMPGIRHKKNPFIVHFKGTFAKHWMELYARQFLL